jgi:UDP-N-acetylmuramate--alanine ligase
MVGIGGIGMSALAQLYHVRGHEVSGSDRSESPVTELLSGQGIAVSIGHNTKNVPETCDLLVYSEAIPQDNIERATARERGVRELYFQEALGEATEKGTSIVVSGTHGKTTTTAMLAKVLIEAGKQPTVICGSLMSEYGSNFVAGSDDLFVIEGCEYKRHFLQLHPNIFVITNIEYDHTDYYRDLEDLQAAFGEVARSVPDEGIIVVDSLDANVRSALKHVHASVVSYTGTVVPELVVPGEFNKANARAAKAAALALDASLNAENIDASLGAFTGTWRRFEYKGTTEGGASVYDDYAHHPTAIKATLEMARNEFPDKRLVVAFHPHLYSRTRDLMEGFVEALSLADEVILAPIYPAREDPIPGVTSGAIAAKLTERGIPASAYANLDEVEQVLVSRDSGPDTGSILITMGAGDIFQVADKLTQEQ